MTEGAAMVAFDAIGVQELAQRAVPWEFAPQAATLKPARV
jgi:hypothetical protein